jgi:titin
VISGNGYDGIQVHDADTVGNLIEGNLIGTDASGSSALANAGNGVEVFQGGAGTTIGGTSAGARNIISGNLEDGVTLRSGATSVLAQGNFIGTELSGSRALPNAGNGVNFYLGARGNTVGGAIAGARNVVSGNAEYGVSITDSATTGNVVSGNFVGTNAAGLSAVPNLMEGVVLLNSTSANTIGGTIAGAGNVISGNGKNGIVLTDHNTSKNVVAGNRVGTDLSSTHAVGNAANGIVLSNGASDNTIGGISSAAGNVISANSYSGVGLYDEETSGNVLQGNFIGTNPSGSRVLANGNNGVELTGGASNNTIGGTLSGAGNVISNNPYAGIAIGNRQTSGNLVQGNRIGTDPSGSVALPNEEGIHFYDGTSQNTIGGSTAAARNVISGNTDNGVDLHDAGTSRNLIEGNYIGTNANATAGVPNRGDGVLVVNLASANTIGGTVAGAGNTIAYNLGNGVAIGESRSESLTGIAVIGNSLFANQQIGIDLVDDGVTANTHGAPHSGPNRLQHFPVLTSAVVSAGAVTVEGTFQGASIAAVRVEFYVNPTSDRTGYGQGEFLLGATEITTDQTGNAKFIRTFTTEMLVTAGEFLTATATDPFGDTSEFSRQQKIV